MPALSPPSPACGSLPSPSAPSPLPLLTRHTMEQGPLGAEAALHAGDSLAVPPGLRTVIVAGGGTYGATGLIHLAPFTLQSWVERREAGVTEVQGHRRPQQRPKLILVEGTGCMVETPAEPLPRLSATRQFYRKAILACLVYSSVHTTRIGP